MGYNAVCSPFDATRRLRLRQGHELRQQRLPHRPHLNSVIHTQVQQCYRDHASSAYQSEGQATLGHDVSDLVLWVVDHGWIPGALVCRVDLGGTHPLTTAWGFLALGICDPWWLPFAVLFLIPVVRLLSLCKTSCMYELTEGLPTNICLATAAKYLAADCDQLQKMLGFLHFRRQNC